MIVLNLEIDEVNAILQTLGELPTKTGAWATYRQALRDISKQTGFPWEVVFPNDPNYVEPTIEPV